METSEDRSPLEDIELAKLTDAVIVEARELREVFDARGWSATSLCVARLADAVEALEAAEKEE